MSLPFCFSLNILFGSGGTALLLPEAGRINAASARVDSSVFSAAVLLRTSFFSYPKNAEARYAVHPSQTIERIAFQKKSLFFLSASFSGKFAASNSSRRRRRLPLSISLTLSSYLLLQRNRELKTQHSKDHHQEICSVAFSHDACDSLLASLGSPSSLFIFTKASSKNH